MTEYLDIVDEQDNVIRKDTRENVHKNYQIHRGIHVFIVNSQGEILIQKRSLRKDDRPGYYDASVGAQVRSGETYEQAALRETQEELGFMPERLETICDYKSYSARQRENRRLFLCHPECPFTIDPEEVDSIAVKNLRVGSSSRSITIDNISRGQNKLNDKAAPQRRLLLIQET